MAETTSQRCAIVTGGNKGIGLEICRQLASNGVVVVLTARDESRGLQAVQKLINGDPSLSDYIVFHQLNVAADDDSSSGISALADFVTTRFGKLDILVNNAGILVDIVDVDDDVMRAETYKLAEECFKTNYYGAKRMIETFLPLLQLSGSPRIVNVSSTMGKFKYVEDEWATGVLSDVENLTEERVEQVVLKQYLKDVEEGSLATKGWSRGTSAYTLSKAALNAYSRIVDAKKKYSNLCINCVCPGYVRTDINMNTGAKTPGEGAQGPVKLALLPDGGPSGRFFDQTEEGSF